MDGSDDNRVNGWFDGLIEGWITNEWLDWWMNELIRGKLK